MPPLWVIGTPELPAPTAQDRFLPWICLSDGGPHHHLLGVWTAAAAAAKPLQSCPTL